MFTSSRRLARAALLALALASAGRGVARAHEVPLEVEELTRFEQFVLTTCSPCVKKAYAVATIATAPLKLPAFPPPAGGAMTRAGEVAFEVLQAYPLGDASRQSLAMRVVISSEAGAGALFRLGTGILDEEDVSRLAAALAAMTDAVAGMTTGAAAGNVEVEFRAGAVRFGVVSLDGAGVVYVQIPGNLPKLALRPVWEVPGVYLPVSDLPRLRRAIEQVDATMHRIRGQ